MKFTCPHCKAKIRHLNYNQAVTEYGTYALEDECTDMDNSEYNGDMNYACPNCGDDIDSPEDLEEVKEEEKKDDDIVEIKPPITKNMLVEESPSYRTYENIIRCPKCETVSEFSCEERSLFCRKCDYELFNPNF